MLLVHSIQYMKMRENPNSNKRPNDRKKNTKRNFSAHQKAKQNTPNEHKEPSKFKQDTPKQPQQDRHDKPKHFSRNDKAGKGNLFPPNTEGEKKPRKFIKKATSNEEKPNVVVKEIWRLNRFIANSGVCSRREADALIAKGEIKVNGKVVTEMGYKVKPNDDVSYQGRTLRKEKPVYLLLNKPKDFITTVKDDKGRKTVMELIKNATDERIYPVGRLDRQTTGLLLFTNDGEMAKKLSHPSYEVQKIYKVELNKPFTDEDVEKMKEGLMLEDGLAKADGVAILSADGMSVGVELHIGKNRIVRRMFAHLGYEVVRLDRTVFAGLTKETLGRGQWRFLTEREIIRLRFFDKRK